jgi:tRNA-2-methylthio-N6-dimethylallyladenosine synthase
MDYSAAIRDILKRISPRPSVFLHSFGCRQNTSDGNSLLGSLLDMGFIETDDIGSAALIIYNTCAVRENAEKKMYGLIGELKHVKEKNPDVIIAITGCMVQQQSVVDFIHKTYHHVDLCVGTFAYAKFPEMLYNMLLKPEFLSDNVKYSTDFSDFNLYQSNSFKADIPIMYGCDNFCSYCIVPYVRGRERSRPMPDILSDVRTLANSGFKEIMLLGQNVNSYGNTLKPPVPFSALLRGVAEIPGDFRVRFMSPHPKDMRKDLIDIIAENPKICRSIHIPLQSGSNRILEQMNRQYSREMYMEIIKYIRKKMPHCNISTDIIIGFPGETEFDFSETLDIVKQAQFFNIYSFIYSKRPGTKAALMEDYAKPDEKTSRMSRLLTLQREIATTMYNGYIGKTFSVLFDTVSKTPGRIEGRADNGVIVQVAGDKNLIGELKNVKITTAHNWAVEGLVL